MPQFRSLRSYWEYEQEVKRGRRFVRTGKANRFLTAVAGSVDTRSVTANKGAGFFRAQMHFEWESRYEPQIEEEVEYPVPASAERMRPQKNRAKEGRANPRGVPVLYMANTVETAMSEVRPWIGSFVSVAAFRLNRDIRIVDCSRFHKDGGYWRYILNLRIDEPQKKPTPAELEEIAWGDIDKAFSTPTEPADDAADYVSTQILAELFKARGFDGIAYKSMLREDGYNFALFDLDVAEIVWRKLYKVESLAYAFEEEYR